MNNLVVEYLNIFIWAIAAIMMILAAYFLFLHPGPSGIPLGIEFITTLIRR